MLVGTDEVAIAVVYCMSNGIDNQTGAETDTPPRTVWPPSVGNITDLAKGHVEETKPPNALTVVFFFVGMACSPILCLIAASMLFTAEDISTRALLGVKLFGLGVGTILRCLPVLVVGVCAGELARRSKKYRSNAVGFCAGLLLSFCLIFRDWI